MVCFFSMLFFFNFKNRISFAALNSLDKRERWYLSDFQIEQYKKQPSLFLTIFTQEEDWWEDFQVGCYINGKIKWLKIESPFESESIGPAVVSARFVELKGFSKPLIEVYSLTHAAHGMYYLYQVNDDNLEILIDHFAVDGNSDIGCVLKYWEKYGNCNCGTKFVGDKLEVEYRDINLDGVDDVVLQGRKKILCEIPYGSEDYKLWQEIEVEEEQVEEIFIWDGLNFVHLDEN